MSKQNICAATGFVVGTFFGMPQLGAAVGGLIAGNSPQRSPTVVDSARAIRANAMLGAAILMALLLSILALPVAWVMGW